MSEIFNESEKAFLRDLTAITRKHNIAVGGCGCCGSPHLIAITEEDAKRGRYGHAEHGMCDFEFMSATEGPMIDGQLGILGE